MADGSQPIGQDEIEQLLQQAQAAGSPESGSPAKSSAAGSAGSAPEGAQQPEATGGEGDTSAALSQSDIENLVKQAASQPSAAAKKPSGGSAPKASSLEQQDIDYLLRQAESAIASIDDDAHDELPPGVKPFQLDDFAGAPASTDAATIDLVRDVELDLRIELGRTHMYLEDVLKLRKGSVVPLEKLAGDPVDVYVNGRLVARGEILVLNDNFCVRVAELVAGENVGTA